MLNREALAKDIFSIISKLFPDLSGENDLAKKVWDRIVSDPSFMHRAACAQSSFLIPSWENNLCDSFSIGEPGEYTVVAVDGSQIYPDRHVAGAGCFLINVGGVTLDYGISGKASFFSHPRVLLPSDVIIGDNTFSSDLVDFKREEHEFAMAVQKTVEIKDKQPVCLMDGSLIFWPLEGKADEIKNFFLDKYLVSLEELHKHKILVAGYISMPKSRELVNLIKLGLCRFTIADCIRCHKEHETFPCKQIECMLDTHIARFFLTPGERTTVFYSTSNIVERYPDHLRPAFVYGNVGSEIIRLEIPKWIASNREALDRVCRVAFDQSKKGYGYPVCLAEAHEQAVVKGGDREFFYHLLTKIGVEHNKKVLISQKSRKKLGIGV